jgi:hypothetical protein
MIRCCLLLMSTFIGGLLEAAFASHRDLACAKSRWLDALADR